MLGLRTSLQVARAQVAELRQRIPILYAIVGINVIALAYTHYDVNPFWDVVIIPALIVTLTCSRLITWARLQPGAMTDLQIRRALSSLSVKGAGIGFIILIWALTLKRAPPSESPLSVLTDEGHAVFFVGITFLSCIFLLMHHRLGAISVALSIVVPFTIYLVSTGRVIETAVALNVVLVTAAMLGVAIAFSRHFERSVVAASDMLRLSAQNARLAASDALTSLPNRRQFFHELEEAGAAAAPFAVIVVDLDGFKQINDVYGHQAGDLVLQQIGSRLLAATPGDCCISRLGGDEFACLLIGEHVGSAQRTAESLIAVCAEPIASSAFTAHIGASAGVCLSSEPAACLPILIYERADYALLEAKRAGRGRVETFSGSHDQSMRRESTIAHELRKAMLDEELTTFFQPIVDADSHMITGFEALVRWTSPELGPVPPQEFIPIAERTDLIFQLSLRVLRNALIHAGTWPVSVSLKVNLSVRDLMSGDQTRALMEELGRSSVDPGRVTFEITETIFGESLEQIRRNVDIVRAAGCKIAIDDFGVGYSNLNYIHALEPDVIKIDRCFVSQVTSSAATKRVIRTIVELARNVGARSVAEGVATLAEARLLAELGCDELQGYYFSRPVAGGISTMMAAAGTVRLAAQEASRVAHA